MPPSAVSAREAASRKPFRKASGGAAATKLRQSTHVSRCFATAQTVERATLPRAKASSSGMFRCGSGWPMVDSNVGQVEHTA